MGRLCSDGWPGEPASAQPGSATDRHALQSSGSGKATPWMHFSTGAVPLELRHEAACKAYAPMYQLAAPDKAGSLNVEIEQSLCHEMLVASARLESLRGVRTRTEVDHGGLDHYLIQCQDVGTFGLDDLQGHQRVVGPGDIGLMDLSRCYQAEVPRMQGVCLFLPRHTVAASVVDKLFHCQTLPAASPLTRMLRKQLVRLWQESTEMDADEQQAAQEMVIDMLNSGFRSLLDVRESAHAQGLRARIDAYVAAQLREPGLDAQHLQHHFGLSRAHVYRLFAADGGVAAHIRNLRLEQCFREIVQARSAQPLGELLRAWGFTNEQQFLRSFRKRYGIAPSQARQLATRPQGHRSVEPLLRSMARASGRAAL